VLADPVLVSLWRAKPELLISLVGDPKASPEPDSGG
jgi:hypothetical protein